MTSRQPRCGCRKVDQYIAEAGFKAGGVTPIPLPLADVYTSLQTGLIDTAANTPAGAIAFQCGTKIKHMIDLPLTYVVGILVIDKKVVDGLSADDQKALNEELGAAFARLEKINRDDNMQARGALEKQGVAIFTPNAEETKAWEAIGAAARKDLAAQNEVTPEMAAALDKALAGRARVGENSGARPIGCVEGHHPQNLAGTLRTLSPMGRFGERAE